MKLAIDAERWMRGTIGLAVLLSLLIMAIGASAQVPMAEVRGQFSDGNGSWNAESFGWFYYDLDYGAGGERLIIEAEGRDVKEGHLIYSSDVWTEEFDFEEWGRYQAVAFLGKRYLAGYLESNFTDAVSALEDGELREVLIDFDGIQTSTSEEPLFFNDGYWLELAGASSDGNEVYLILKKNGLEVDRAVVGLGDTYVYEVGEDDLPIIMAHISAAMQGADKAIVDFNGIFQVRELPTIKLETGAVIDLMEVSTLSDRRIELENCEDLVLRRDSTTTLVGDLMLRVRDSPNLIYYPLGAITEYGLQEIRGPVYNEESLVQLLYSSGFISSAEARWNYENFTGFYFDDEDDIGGESLILFMSEDGIIQPGHEFTMNETRVGYGFKYTTFVEPVKFEFDQWGSYDATALFGQLWFAGYGTETNPDIGTKSMIEMNQLGQVLLDTDESFRIVGGIALTLEEEYEVYTIDVSNDSVFIMLVRQNEILDRAVVQSNSTYVYKKDVGDVDELPLIALHVGSVFSDDEEHFAIVDGIFQVSDRLIIPIDLGNDFGELEVKVANSDYIIMANPEWVHMKRDSKTSILPYMSIAVADNDTYRYYLYTSEYVLPPPKILDVSLPEDPVPSGGVANFSIFVQAGDITSVTAETFDSKGQLILPADMTGIGVGDRDMWFYSWQWNATVPALSDDETVLFESDVRGGFLQVNNSTEPVQVTVSFDEYGWISFIQDLTGEIYYISPAEYENLGASPSYGEMASNESLRSRYVKVEPGVSEIWFFQVVNGTTIRGETGHKLWFSPQGLEPHIVRVGAPRDRYEIRLRVENANGALQVTGLYFDVSAPDRRTASVGSAKVQPDERFNLPLAIPASENDTQMTLTFNPDLLTFEGTEGASECDIEQDLSKKGEIGLDIPGNCSAFNLTFKSGKREGITEVEIADVEGLKVDEVKNGTVNVTLLQRPGGASEPQKKAGRIPAPGAIVSLAAMGLAAVLVGWRRR